MKRLTLTAFRDTPIRIILNDEVVDIYFVKNKGSFKAQIAIEANETVRIQSPSFVKKQNQINKESSEVNGELTC